MVTNIKEINTSEISEQPIRRIYIKKGETKKKNISVNIRLIYRFIRPKIFDN